MPLMTESTSMKRLMPLAEIENKIIHLVETKMYFDLSSQDIDILSLAKKQHPFVEHLIDHITVLFPKIMAAIEERKLRVTNGYLTILQSVEQKRNIITTRISGALSGSFLRPNNNHDDNKIITVNPTSIRPATAQDKESWFLTAELVTTSSKYSSYVPVLSCLLGLGDVNNASKQPPPVVYVQAKLVEVVSSQVILTRPKYPRQHNAPHPYFSSYINSFHSPYNCLCYLLPHRAKSATDILAPMLSKNTPCCP